MSDELKKGSTSQQKSVSQEKSLCSKSTDITINFGTPDIKYQYAFMIFKVNPHNNYLVKYNFDTSSNLL